MTPSLLPKVIPWSSQGYTSDSIFRVHSAVEEKVVSGSNEKSEQEGDAVLRETA